MGWEQLKPIREQSAQDQRDLNREHMQPTVCPIDGELLLVRSDGVRNCPAGNFTYGGSVLKH
jgi:hypothetical protein